MSLQGSQEFTGSRTGSVLELDRAVVEQNVPALDLLVLVLEAFVPVLQTLPFSLDAQLASSCRHTGVLTDATF